MSKLHSLVPATNEVTTEFRLVDLDHPTRDSATITLKNDAAIRLGLNVTGIANEICFGHNCAAISIADRAGWRKVIFWHNEGVTQSVLTVRAPTWRERFKSYTPVVENRWAGRAPHKDSRTRLSIHNHHLHYICDGNYYPPSCSFLLTRGSVPAGYFERANPQDLARLSLA